MDPAPALHAAPAHPYRELIEQLRHSEPFQSYRQAFERATGLPLALREPDTFHAPLHGSRHANPFCVAMAGRSHACAACLRAQQALFSAANAGPATFECEAGMVESAVPVRVNAQTVAFLQTGQVFIHRPDRKRFSALLTAVGAAHDSESDLKASYFSTRVVTEEFYQAAVRLLQIFAQHLANLTYQTVVQQSLSESPIVAKARSFVASHLGDEIHLHDVARATNTSSYYFCKMFRKLTGSTFTTYIARERVAAVQKAITNPSTRISDAAYANGFQSLSQFNRVFRRLTGDSPTGYRARLHVETC